MNNNNIIKKKPKHRRADVYVKREFNYEGPLRNIPDQSWYKPVNQYLKRVS